MGDSLWMAKTEAKATEETYSTGEVAEESGAAMALEGKWARARVRPGRPAGSGPLPSPRRRRRRGCAWFLRGWDGKLGGRGEGRREERGEGSTSPASPSSLERGGKKNFNPDTLPEEKNVGTDT